MNLAQIEKNVREILNRQIDGVVIKDFVDDSDIMEILGSDLLELVKALMAIEERFNIEFEHDTAIESITVESIVEHIGKCQKLAA